MTAWTELKLLRWRDRGVLRPLCAGSGLARVRGGFWAVADDLHHLVRVPDGRGAGAGRRLFPGEPPRDPARRKKTKKDLECLIDLGGGRLVAFPSGSKERRRVGSLIRLDGRGRFMSAREVDFGPLLSLLGERVPGLNVEGGFVRGKRVVLLQRGNGRAGFNALVKLRLKAFLRGLEGHWKPSALRPKIRRVPLGSWGRASLAFTDGFCLDGIAYFAAAAEGGKDTYRDGRVFGSVVGVLPRRGKPVILARLPGEKIEGLAPRARKDGRLELCAVTDADDPNRPSRLLRVWIDEAR